MRWTCRAFDDPGEVRSGSECVDVSSSPAKPAIKPVGKRRCVRYGDIQTACSGTDHAAHLAQRSIEIVKVFQTVVGNDRLKDPRPEREFRCVGLNDQGAGVPLNRSITVEPHTLCQRCIRVEASCCAPEIEDITVSGQALENLMHTLSVAEKRRRG